jgi:hypothetical protein
MLRTVALVVLLSTPQAALAFEPVTERDEFIGLVKGRALKIALYSLSLTIDPKGTIQGRALGADVRGTWQWQDGYFCRKMLWSDIEIPQNCQLVEQKDGKLRFTSDKGAGMSAAFVLK